jgi:hypothetical protein
VGAEIDPSDIRTCFIGDSLVNGVGDPEYLGWQAESVPRPAARDAMSPTTT